MSAKKPLLPLFLALSSSAALAAEDAKPPAGFETVPVSSPAQEVVAKKADVYFVVSSLPAKLPPDADATLVANAAVPESAGEMTAAWDGPAVRAKAGDGAKGLEALIGNAGDGIRIVTCQWGVGGRDADAGAREACLAALSTKYFDAPGAPALPFTPPEGFKRTLSPDMLYIGVRDKDVIYAVEAALKVDPAEELQGLTDKISKTFAAEGLVVKDVTPTGVGDKKVVRVKGTSGEATVVGYMVPFPEGTLFIGAQTQGDPSAELDAALQKMVASAGAPPPAAPPAAAAADAGPDAAKSAPTKEAGGETWKTAALIGGLIAAAAVLTLLMRAGAARRARERRAAARGGTGAGKSAD